MQRILSNKESMIVALCVFAGLVTFLYVNVHPLQEATQMITEKWKKLEEGKDIILTELELIRKFIIDILRRLPGH